MALEKQKTISNIVQLMKSGNIDAVFQEKLANDPRFRDFVEKNKGKTPEEVAAAYGVDFNLIKQFLG